MGKQMEKFNSDRCCGIERRRFHYTIFIPEIRSGKDRRIRRNGKEVLGLNLADKNHQEEQNDTVKEKQLFRQLYSEDTQI